MMIPSFLRTVLIYLLSLLLTNAPNLAFAEGVKEFSGQMIPTSHVIADLTRAQAENKIEEFLSRSEVRQQLLEQGVSSEEVSLRMAALSESELKQLAHQVQQARAGGDILFTILIVVLIIYIVKRL